MLSLKQRGGPDALAHRLDNVSFTIKAGDLVSIVGKSGSGKSTLIALLVRLHDCDTGTILIDGIGKSVCSLTASSH